MLSCSIMDRLRRLDHKITIAYLYINLAADDDGVCQAVDSALAGTGCGEDEINALIDLGFILRHPEQPYRVLVSHWMLHNTIPASRKAPLPASRGWKDGRGRGRRPAPVRRIRWCPA